MIDTRGTEKGKKYLLPSAISTHLVIAVFIIFNHKHSCFKPFSSDLIDRRACHANHCYKAKKWEQ